LVSRIKTCALSKSTSAQRSPNNSPLRSPVSSAR
jgi:hypothetical protein